MSIRSSIERLCRDEDGTAAILWAISLVVVFGLTALAFDIGRLGATQSELQSFADNVALAAAGELDGKADAITRATAAAQNLISDTQTFGNGSQALAGSVDYTLTFYAALPASDDAPMDPDDITTDPVEAVFAEVVVVPRSVTMAFRAATDVLLGGADGGPATVGATAVAGYTQEACDITPLMFCLPDPSFMANAEIGTMIRLRAGGSGAAWGPGDFGFLDPSRADLGATCAGLNGGNLLRCLFGAEQNVTQCYSQRGVITDPGQSIGITDVAFNTRFDIYKGSMGGEKNNPLYRPAPNVISGLKPKGGSCIGQNEETAYPDTIPLPHDDCFVAGTCTRFGNGEWDYAKYIDTNHGNANGTLDAGEDSHLTAHSVDPKYAGTRYETYLREIAHGDSVAGGDILSGQGWETGRPQCSTNMSPRPERRVLIAAGIDCATYDVRGRTSNLPVEEFFEIFMTEPVGDDGGSPPNVDIWVEVIGSAGGDGYSSAGPGGIFRDVVQLYR